MAKGFKEIQYSIYAEEEGDGQGASTWSHGREIEVISTLLPFIQKHQSIRRLMVLAQHRISHRRPWFALACLHLDRNSVHCSRHLQPEAGRARARAGVPGIRPTVKQWFLSWLWTDATFFWCYGCSSLVSKWQICETVAMKESSALVLLLAGLTSQVPIIQGSTSGPMWPSFWSGLRNCGCQIVYLFKVCKNSKCSTI